SLGGLGSAFRLTPLLRGTPKNKKPRNASGASYTFLRSIVYHISLICQEKSSLPLKIFSTSRLFWCVAACRSLLSSLPRRQTEIPQHLSRGPLSGALFFISA